MGFTRCLSRGKDVLDDVRRGVRTGRGKFRDEKVGLGRVISLGSLGSETGEPYWFSEPKKIQ